MNTWIVIGLLLIYVIKPKAFNSYHDFINLFARSLALIYVVITTIFFTIIATERKNRLSSFFTPEFQNITQ